MLLLGGSLTLAQVAWSCQDTLLPLGPCAIALLVPLCDAGPPFDRLLELYSDARAQQHCCLSQEAALVSQIEARVHVALQSPPEACVPNCFLYFGVCVYFVWTLTLNSFSLASSAPCVRTELYL